ncbi:MAG: nucleotidyl transferase AbiEii/AbiGii toxin family protein [Flavobacteriales bacterium]|nr:nucleotidyl transferase AbiEii/AbiGii toxin family protein [Flavobacteriales bacterium]
MIKPGEIQKKANQVGVRDQQIEKDYILSWILWGVANHKQLSKILVFKGGTVLKKVYFENYRFSEDLDFTLLDSEISNEQIFEWFNEIFIVIMEEAKIPLKRIDDNEDDEEKLEEEKEDGLNFFIGYIGPLGGFGNNKKVKVDISKSEKLEFKPAVKNAIVDYSDLEEYSLLCYPLEELLVEKLRCTMQRMQPRDYYDIWYLVEVEEMDVDFFTNEFRNKCIIKQQNPKDFHEKLEQRLPQYKARWQKSMKDQIKDLPDFEKVEREVSRKIKNFMK